MNNKFIKSLIVILLFLLISGLNPGYGQAALADRWQQRSFNLTAVAYGNGTFTAVGHDGRIQTSPEGISWTICNSGIETDLGGIVFGNNLFLAVGSGGTVLSSPDGVNWSKRNSGTTNQLSDVAFGNGTFVAVGDSGTIITSPDGETWTPQPSGVTAWLRGVAYGNSRFVAVGTTIGNAIILRSDAQGMAWDPPQISPVPGLAAVTFGNGRFMANGEFKVATSTDGSLWTPYTRTGRHSAWGLGYGNGIFFSLSGDSYVGSLEYSIDDGQNWNTLFCCNDYLLGAAFGNNLFLVVGYGSKIFSSANGTNWEETVSGISNPANGLAYGQGQFVAVGDFDAYPPSVPRCSRSSASILTSPDGRFWQFQSSDVAVHLYGAAYGNGKFAVAGQGYILTSPDGRHWTRVGTYPLTTIYGLTYGNGLFVGVGKNHNLLRGVVVTSAPWSNPTDLWVTRPLRGVAYGHNRYVAVGEDGTITTSTNPGGGIGAWDASTSPTSNPLNGVAFGNGLFVAVGDGGAFLTSPDGLSWTKQSVATTKNIRGVAFVDGNFSAVGETGTILVSSDGVLWQTHHPGTSFNLMGIAAGQGTFVVGGSAGTILQSLPADVFLPLIIKN